MIIDGEGDRIDKKAPDIFFDSPENVIVDMPVDAIEQLFASQAAERKASVLEFTPDEIRITAENKFDDGIYELLYEVWKETSGEYNPKDDKPIVDPRGNVHTQNETKFKYWAMEQYGMTSEEYRGHTLDGTLKTLGEIDMAKDKVMIALALPSMIKNAAKTVKDVANGVPFDTSIGFAAGNDATEKSAKDKAENILRRKAANIEGKIESGELPSAKGLIGHDFEHYLHEVIGGESKYIKGTTAGRDFDGVFGNRWYEAKSGNYWNKLVQNKSIELNFKQKMSEGLKIAQENGASYELFSNSPIPDSIKKWLIKKGIPFTEILD